jgi:hypothetical protein
MGNEEQNGGPFMSEGAVKRNENFRRIATRRVNSTLKQLALIEQMASTNYKYDMEEVEVMLTAVESAVERVRQRYVLSLTRKTPTTAGHSFTF